MDIKKYIYNENNYIHIKYKNKKLKILRYISESNNRFNNRINFIKLLLKNNIYDKNIELLSLYWYNINYIKCKYDEDMTEFIKNIK